MIQHPYHPEEYVECYPSTIEFWNNLLAGKGVSAKGYIRYYLYLGEREFPAQDSVVRNALHDLDKILTEFLQWNLGEIGDLPSLPNRVNPLLQIISKIYLPTIPESVAYTVSGNPKNIIAKW